MSCSTCRGGRMTRSIAGRRLLIGHVRDHRVALVAGTDGWIIRHFGAHAATDQGADNYLSGIACPSATTCWAVGQTAIAPGGNTLSEVRPQLIQQETAGSGIRRRHPPGARPESGPDRYHLPRPPRLLGGRRQQQAAGPAIIEHWTGGSWQLAPLARADRRPAGQRELRLGELVLGVRRQADPPEYDHGRPRAVGRNPVAADLRTGWRLATDAVRLSRGRPLPDRRAARRSPGGGQLRPWPVEPGRAAGGARGSRGSRGSRGRVRYPEPAQYPGGRGFPIPGLRQPDQLPGAACGPAGACQRGMERPLLDGRRREPATLPRRPDLLREAAAAGCSAPRAR